MEQRGSGGKGYVVADDRDADARQRRVPPRDPVVLVRLFDRTGADTRRFTVGDRIYRANGRSASPKLDSGDGREDQPVVGGATAVAPRATYTITSAAERAITTAAALLSPLFARFARWRRFQPHHRRRPIRAPGRRRPRGRPRTGADA
ncbi:hypothetical protein JL721_10661 [Aureococcus anophagefferens]|nr:hypothetical protein JL721_10661 [Aureococcus anophagefferens]